MQAIGIRKRWQAVNSDVYSRRPLVLRWAVAPWLSCAAVSRLGKRRESQSIYRLERWHASLPPCWPRVAHLTAVWVPLALAALGQVFRDCQWCCNIKAIFFRSASMKGGWIIPAGSFLLKIMHIYECSSMILGAITECFIPEGFFFLLAQSDLNYPSTISLTSQAITFPPKQPFWELVSWLKKGQTFLFPTTWPLSLKSWSSFYIRPPLSPTLSQLFTPSMDIFILRTLDVWATVCWKRYLHCPPVVEMDFE